MEVTRLFIAPMFAVALLSSHHTSSGMSAAAMPILQARPPVLPHRPLHRTACSTASGTDASTTTTVSTTSNRSACFRSAVSPTCSSPNSCQIWKLGVELSHFSSYASDAEMKQLLAACKAGLSKLACWVEKAI